MGPIAIRERRSIVSGWPANRWNIDMTFERADGKNSSYLVPFLVLLAAYCVWVLTLPLFPSLDGSLHLYYASVLGSLLSGSKDFASYYFIRHILPPYALHYYFLIAIAHFFGYVMADKLLVCLIFIVTACGFRYLSLSLGPSGDLMSLFIIPLLLNWPLGMGFYNYCLAIGMALWALGFWYRAVEHRSHRLWAAFLITVVLMVFTHPVPLLLIYALVGLDVAWRMLKRFRGDTFSELSARQIVHLFRFDVLYMLLAWSTVGYIALFVSTKASNGNLIRAYPRSVELLRLAKLSTLAMFSGFRPLVAAYRISLYLLLLLAVILACNGIVTRWRNEKNTAADLLLICSLLLLIAIPLLPGSNYIAQRLVVVVWIGTLASASGHTLLSISSRRTISGIAIAYAFGFLVFANARIRPVASQIVQIENAPLTLQRGVGFVLGLPNPPDPSDLNYIPYYWAGARYFRRTNSILLNGGWLYQNYLPLGSRLNQISEHLTPETQDSPGDLYQLLLHSASARKTFLPRANLLIFTGRIGTDRLSTIVKTVDDSEPTRTWTCDSREWYSICMAPFASPVR